MSARRVPLEELCEMDRQGIQPDDPPTAELPFVGVENVAGGTGILNFDTDSRIGGQKSTAFRFDRRHVLYGKLRPYLNKVAVPDFAGRCSTELVPLLPRDGVDRDFLAHLLRRKETVEFVMASVTGARMPRADMKVLRSMPVPFPSLDEQRRIAGVLNCAARIEHLHGQTTRYLREFASALFVKMFGDPVENPMAWRSCKMGNLGTLDRGRSKHRPRNAPHLYGGSYPFIQTGDVATSGGLITEYTQTYSEAGLAQSRIWSAGTLCITIAANIGMTGVLAFNACFPDSVVGFLPNNRVTVEYIQTGLDLMQNRIEERAPQSAQRNINLKILRELELPVAPFRLQCRFTECVTKVRDMMATAQSTSQTASALSVSLMARLL